MDFALPGMDTKTLSEEGVAVAIKDLKTAKPIKGKDGADVTITVLGPDSRAYRMQTRDAVRKRLRAAQADEADASAKFDADEAEAVDMLARITKSWTGICNTEGKPIPCTVETATALYAAFPAIRDQVDSFVAIRTNFIKA